MSEYEGCPVFGTMACQRCGSSVSGMYWANFRVNGELIGDICEPCRNDVMADYIIPCAYRAHGDEWFPERPERTIGERFRAAAEQLKLNKSGAR